MAALAQYLSQRRIEGPIWLEPTDISFLRARISDVEGQVENLESQVSELTRQKDAKLVEIASLKNLLSPIRRVPPEILSEIFELACLPEEGKSMYEHDIVQYTSILCSVIANQSYRSLGGLKSGLIGVKVPQQIETFLGAPKLQCVELIEGDSDPILNRFALPAEQLTSLKITSTIVDPSDFDPDAYTSSTSEWIWG
ncbi:hypothetical protein BT96DRAFT_972896 [Gymnopus androsaceus JB14]|uniref:F-box domain-containing protein n=1 Tax=Gymnopus androsaceus JB14 TaxID=1447944 RepID=A0A6A4I2X3_9AGAR|nr:hypothetical protein BT96DRAFT_972896 [Gymnopus androsaceus JB14]